MMAEVRLDAHARPPDSLRTLFKKWQKATPDMLLTQTDLLDPQKFNQDNRVIKHKVSEARVLSSRAAMIEFFDCGTDVNSSPAIECFEIKAFPGLFVFPSLLPDSIQASLLDKLMHRDLSNPCHKTNLHLHYRMPNEPATQLFAPAQSLHSSFFGLDPGFMVNPKDPSIHKPLSVQKVLEKKLRWVTLGGQYDWTQKTYPKEKPPQFPDDIANLLRGLFPDVEPQAAILNFYSPGDTLSLHRDVSEECDQALVSISIGCDAIFLVASTDSQSATIRLRSGDTILMSAESRYAWHAVPKIIPGTCPDSLSDWPFTSDQWAFNPVWKGWLANKRVNLNVRQMRKDIYDYGDEAV